ncbi:hypothetical protein B0T25DRAFT_134943 [Lasiosphaeria hispida]|uniref:Uncharacterized protein n=1 Tax=Lasiosphaeria hispida TaxID=260671 RepID=A0AAJ0HKR7_9PEZI|nr:hypothetical protein B0T25DRAFT_134943 [Lasiosphaeria hispida]
METSNSTPPGPQRAAASPDAAQQEASEAGSQVSPLPSPSLLPARPVSPEHPSTAATVHKGGDLVNDADLTSSVVSFVSSISTDAPVHAIEALSPTDIAASPATGRTSSDQVPDQSIQTPAIAPSEDPPPASSVNQSDTSITQGSTGEAGVHPATPTTNTPPPPPTPEANPYGSWRPGYLRKSTLFAFVCIFIVLLVAVEAIYLVSENRNGLEEANEALSWLWTFSPTIAMTILASLWLRVEYQAMRYTPWARLARWRAESLGSPNDRARRSASRTLLVDYPNMSPAKAIWKAIRFGDNLVTAAVVVSVVIYIQITISTGLINSEPRQFNDAISVLVEDRLTTAGRDDDIASLPMVAINGMATLNMTIPNGHTRRHAFQWFSPDKDVAGSAFSAVEATVGVGSVDIQCEVATLGDPTNELAPDTLFLRFNSSYCTSRQLIVENQAQNSMPLPEGRSYFWVYDERAACQNNRKGIVLAAVVAVDRKGENLTYVSSSRVMCSVGLVFGNATVKIADGQPELSSVNMGQREADVDILSELQTHRLDNIRSGSDLQENTGADYQSELQLSPFRVGASLLPGGPPDVTALLEHETLQEVIKAWMLHFGAVLLHYNHRTPDQQVIAGQALVMKDRLIVNRNVAHGMAGGFALMALMAVWMVFYAPPSNGFVPRDPDTISGCAVLLSRSSDLLALLHGTGHKTLKDVTEQVSGSYRTAIQPSPDNALSPTFHLKKDDPEVPGPELSDTQNATSGEFRPWSPMGLRGPVRWIGLIAMVGIAGTAVGLLIRSNRDNGFFNTGDNANIQYLWTILPTLVMEALTIYIKGSDFSIRALAPFTALQSRSDTFERALAVSYTNELGPATIYKAVRQRNWAVVISKTMATLCALLPIITNALFSVENLEVEIGVQLQQQTWFGSGDYETISWQAPTHVADMLLRDDVNSTSPPWSYDEWAFHIQTPVGDDVASADPTDLSLRARLAAVSVDLDCQLSVRPGPIPADDGIQLEVRGQNTSCFGGFDYRKHHYFAGSAGGHYLSSACSNDLPPTDYVWGRCTGDVIDFIAHLACNETAVEQDFDATLSGPGLTVDTTLQPPVPLPDTTRPYSFHGKISDIYIGLLPGDKNLDESPSGAYLDRFFRSLITQKIAMPISHLDSPSTADLVTAAIKKQHAIVRAQTLNYDGRAKMAVTRALRLPFTSDAGNNTANETQAQYPPYTAPQPAPQPATLHHSPNRLVQSGTATYVTLSVLFLVFVLDLVSILTTKKIQMPKSPGGIAAIASLLADSTIFKHLPPEGVEWMGDEELAGHFRGRGATFRMDWFGAGRGGRYYTIGVVEDEQVALDEVGVEVRDLEGGGGGGGGDEEGLVTAAAPIGS